MPFSAITQQISFDYGGFALIGTARRRFDGAADRKNQCEQVYKPSSVFDGHLSRRAVASALKRFPRGVTGRHKMPLYQPCTRWGLHSGQVTKPLVSSYLTFPPLRPACCGVAVSLCCTFLEVAFTGSYPAPCPMELGLSSDAFAPATIWLTRKFYSFPSRTYKMRPQFSHSTNSFCSLSLLNVKLGKDILHP